MAFRWPWLCPRGAVHRRKGRRVWLRSLALERPSSAPWLRRPTASRSKNSIHFLRADNVCSWRRAGFQRSTGRRSTSSFARWRLRLHRAVPSSPTCSGAPPLAYPVATTAFGLRRDHVLVEILASFTDRSEPRDEHWNQRWVQAARRALDGIALPGGYPN